MSDTFSLSASSTTPITSTDDSAMLGESMGGSMEGWTAPAMAGTSSALAPAVPASPKTSSGIVMSVPINSGTTPRGRGPSGVRRTVGSPANRSQSSSSMQREIDRLRKELSSVKRDLEAEQSTSKTRLDVIMHQQQEEQRKLNLAMAQSKHIAQTAAEEHAEAVAMKQHYEDAQKGASNYAQSAWQSHQQAELYADRCVKLAEESFRRQNEAEAAAYDARRDRVNVLSAEEREEEWWGSTAARVD